MSRTDGPSGTSSPSSGAGEVDRCRHCGYDITNNQLGICPECGAAFVTGQTLAALRGTLHSTEVVRCIACGTVRADPDQARCPTCNTRFRVKSAVAPADDRRRAPFPALETAEVRPSFAPMVVTMVAWMVLAGFVFLVAGWVIADLSPMVRVASQGAAGLMVVVAVVTLAVKYRAFRRHRAREQNGDAGAG